MPTSFRDQNTLFSFRFMSAPSGPKGLVSRLRSLKGDMQAVVHDIHQGGSLRVDGRRLGNKWRFHVPMLARTCADAIRYARKIFPNLPFTADQLRDAEEEVRELGELLLSIQQAVATINHAYNARRQELCDATAIVVSQVRALQQAPLLEAEQLTLVSEVAAPIDQILGDYNGSVRTTRLRNKTLRTEGMAQVAEVAAQLSAAQAENQVLRGGRLQQPIQPAAPKQAPRRPARRTPR